MGDKVNMFEKAAEERRKKYIEENDFVADEILGPKAVEEECKENPLLSQKTKITKSGVNYYIEDRIAELIGLIAEETTNSKSEVVNQLLISCISGVDIIKALSSSSEPIRQMVDKINNK